MKKSVILAVLLFLGLSLLGCISGEQNETVKSDGGIHRFVSIDKTGLLMNASCKSLKNLMQNSPEVKTADLEYFELACRETESELIIEVDLPYGDEKNPVKIIEKKDGKYLRYETELLGLTTKIIMPSKVTSHNGELLNENTVVFKGSEALQNIFDQNASKKIIYVESKKPEIDPSMLIYFVGGIIVTVVLIGTASYLLLKRRKKG